MAKCSECGGQIICLQNAVYRFDGGSSGEYRCQKCGKTKSWSLPGSKEQTIDMSEKDRIQEIVHVIVDEVAEIPEDMFNWLAKKLPPSENIVCVSTPPKRRLKI